ncbi:MAG TPA: phenylalanine--tRNA ligase subunit beta [Candidatus Saccharimonadales bacterium]|nr:phenylalanine--tRNA ligase subunit beta [Candidatus Saccharimonadales bacterium]
MKISANWVRDFVSPAVSDRDVAEALTVSGIAIEGYFGEGADETWEAEITTNRVDAMNHYGVAREVSAIYNLDLAPIDPKVSTSVPADFPIVIDDAAGCARYTARIVRGVKIAPAPVEIAHRLELIDQRSISNVADATNYVLNEIGQPTHAFDLDKLEGGKIIVRRARAGEVLTTLDGVERKLAPEDLVIADAVKPVAIAGVMGGESTMITYSTKNVLIESAWFDPASVRRTARRLGMHTDASHRYERGADPGITQLACARVAELIVASAGGVASQEIDVIARTIPQPRIPLSSSEVQRILGVEVASTEIIRILHRLGFVIEGSGPEFRITVPTWRLDVEREIDLIEEVARIYSYLRIPNTLPSFAGGVVELPNARKQAELRSRLLALGYNESLSSTFIPQEDARFFVEGAANAEPVRIANPLSEEASFLRTSLVPGLLLQVAYNLNRGNSEVRLFEAGHVYAMQGETVDEHNSLAFVGTGAARESSVHGKPESLNFFHVKGDVERLLAAFEAPQVTFDRTVPTWLHPGRAARAKVGDATVAIFGQLHPEIAAARKLKQDVFIAEVFVEALYKLALHQPTYTPISKYPAVERDFSFVLPDGVEFESIRQKLSALAIPEFKAILPAETFRGGSLAAGTYSFLLRVRFQSAERTLRDDEVANWALQIVKAVQALGGSLRQ